MTEAHLRCDICKELRPIDKIATVRRGGKRMTYYCVDKPSCRQGAKETPYATPPQEGPPHPT